MIAQNAETFGKISPLLQWFAHRVTTIVMKDEDSDDEEETGLEEGALVKKQVQVCKTPLSLLVYPLFSCGCETQYVPLKCLKHVKLSLL